MSNKLNTIRHRITYYSLLIMAVTIVVTVFSVYLLQGSTAGLTIADDEIKYFSVTHAGSEGVENNTEALVNMIATRVDEQQEVLFIRLVAISFVVLVIGGVSIYILTKRELEPLDKLKKETESIDFQNHKTRIKVDSKRDEIVTLSNSFNTMLKKLESTYLMQKKFAQNAAHELKTPITTMKTSIQVARMTNKDKEIVYDDLEDQVTRMHHLVQELLTLNRRGKVNFEVCDIRKLIETKLAILGRMISDKNINIEINGELSITTDPGLLGLILNNIIENAIKYNKAKGTIKITLGNTIRIEDTGIGIDPQELENIFIPFYCVDDSRSKALGGFGLGLSIVKECLDALKYDVKVSSTVGKGTTIDIIYKKKKN